MRIIGFNFTKISIEKLKEITSNEDLKVNTEINVLEIKEVKTDILKTKEEILGIDFTFNVNYEPEIAKISLTGKFLAALDPKKAKEAINKWKSKEMSEELRLFFFNVILKKSTLRALYLEEELNLPPHIPLPSFKKENKEN